MVENGVSILDLMDCRVKTRIGYELYLLALGFNP